MLHFRGKELLWPWRATFSRLPCVFPISTQSVYKEYAVRVLAWSIPTDLGSHRKANALLNHTAFILIKGEKAHQTLFRCRTLPVSHNIWRRFFRFRFRFPESEETHNVAVQAYAIIDRTGSLLFCIRLRLGAHVLATHVTVRL
jgi:hypothetical protein